MKSMKKSPKQNWESNIRRTPIILGLSAALCMPSAFSYANASDPVPKLNHKNTLKQKYNFFHLVFIFN